MFESFRDWINENLGTDAYEVKGKEIICKHFIKRCLPWWRIPYEDITSWQEYCVGGWGGGVDIKFMNGRSLSCEDSNGELVKILKRVAPTKELTFELV